MKVHLVYFSPNGTTLKSLRNIAQGMGDVEIEELDLLPHKNRDQKHTFGPDDLVLFGSATAGMLFGKVDEIFDSIEGNQTPFVGIVLYGNGYYGVSLMQMEKKAIQKGFLVSALGAFIGQYALRSDIAAGRPDAKDEQVQMDFGKAIYDKIIVRKDYRLDQKPRAGWSGKAKYNMVVALRHLMMNKEYKLTTSMKRKTVSDDCIVCRKCEKNCPEQAIDIEHKHFDLKACIGCCRCINNCPQKAITAVDKLLQTVNKGFFRDFQVRKEPEILI